MASNASPRSTQHPQPAPGSQPAPSAQREGGIRLILARRPCGCAAAVQSPVGLLQLQRGWPVSMASSSPHRGYRAAQLDSSTPRDTLAAPG
jgi:hypothetical protein